MLPAPACNFAGAHAWRPSRDWRSGSLVRAAAEEPARTRRPFEEKFSLQGDDRVDISQLQIGEAFEGTVVSRYHEKFSLQGDDRVDISQLQIGEAFEGTVVSRYHDKCLYVDVGAKLPGMVTAAECEDGFPLKGFTARKGDKVNVRVLDIAGPKLYLTMRSGDLARPPREKITNGDLEAFRQVDSSEWLEGVVTGITMFGVFVKVPTPGGGPDAVGMVHKNDFRPDFVDQAILGGKVKVRVQVVVQEQLTFTMKDP